MASCLFLIVLFQLILSVYSWDNGLALTPPMGFSTWNFFRFNFNETTFYEITDSFISSGMKSVGYEYINVDAGWWYQINNTIIRNSSGYLTYDPIKYPSGIQSVINYIHSKGLKYGHYTDNHTKITIAGISEMKREDTAMEASWNFPAWPQFSPHRYSSSS